MAHSSHNNVERELAVVLQQLHEITESVSSDLRVLRSNPLLASSSKSRQHVDQIASKTEEVIQILNQLSVRGISRHKETKVSRRRGDVPVPKPDILQRVSMQQYQDMEQFATQVLDVVEVGTSLNLPVKNSSHRHSNGKQYSHHGHRHRDAKHSTWCQRSYRHVVPTLEGWIHLLAENQKQELLAEGPPPNTEHGKMVSHFQRLFDVPTDGGVYTRMNELYVRVGEMQNIIHSLKDILGLDEEASSGSVVTATKQLCELYSGSTAHLLGQLLQQERLDRFISRMHHYRKFFPIFDDMVKDLMEILGVVSMERIVPAVRALKLLIP
ncbi:uncharacterized protein LOC117287739 [Asterias rubens]|uniref:uncharacterized protein LOC117287739 n=1 Tax=Asterias rubens TaxID=7604 RepID=UPI001455D357|nr:uncharacterized protein LOC117287739 [Asterias rubens]